MANDGHIDVLYANLQDTPESKYFAPVPSFLASLDYIFAASPDETIDASRLIRERARYE